MELYNSNTYYGLEVSDGLKHYKYLRKYKKNGKWRYQYTSDYRKKNTSDWLNQHKSINEYNRDYLRKTNDKKATAYSRNSNDWFSKTSTVTNIQGNKMEFTNVGILERTGNLIKNIANKTLDDIEDTINAGAKFIKNLFS